MKRRPKGVATTAVHAGTKVPESITMPKVPPIYAASVFSFDSLAQLDEVWEGRSKGYVYSRMRNPGIDLLEDGDQPRGRCGSGRVCIGHGSHHSIRSIRAFGGRPCGGSQSPVWWHVHLLPRRAAQAGRLHDLR